MAIQFILGRSGSGKTSYCIKAIVSELLQQSSNQPLLFLVPEQATYQAERAILNSKSVAGYHRLHVLSFDRLQFLLLGKSTARPAVSRIGQQMIIHRILQENQSKMKLFHPSANWTGLARKIADTITELHQYAKTPDDIDQFLNELQKDERNSLTALKFTDIKLIFQQYLKFIEGRFIDPDLQLTQACRAIANADFVKGAKLWVDGFASFTTSELAILTEILKATADTQIALCLDPSKINLTGPQLEHLDPTSIFYPTQRTYAELLEQIKKCKLKLAKPIILNQSLRFTSCPQLAHIEKNIFSSKTNKIRSEDNIRIITAPNARAEVQFVAKQILRLVREKGYRYRDIAVIASDLDSYEHYIKAYFENYAIPFFLDKRKQLNQHPVAELIRSALQVIVGNFTHSDIFAYLKTDLVRIPRAEIDLLENYCLAFGINGSDWQSDSDWNFAAQDEQSFDGRQINQIRRKAINDLLWLRDALSTPDNPKGLIEPDEFTRTIFAFLDRLQIRQTLASWIEQAAEQKDYTAVEEHQQFYDKLINIFDELCEVFASKQLSCQDYLAILGSAFSRLTLAFIPPTLDQVLVGSIERSRHPELKAVFLIGATQRHFPVPVTFDSIVTEDDRQIAESTGFRLAPAASQILIERQYLAYIAFTRPSRFLCICYPMIDDKGSALIRSQFIDNLETLFEDLMEEQIPADQTDIDNIHSEIELVDLLCSRLGKDNLLPERDTNEQLFELLNNICVDEQFSQLGSEITFALNYDNRGQLDKNLIEELFGSRLRTSATRLGTFAACPYQYFARYILELEERKEFKLQPLDLGDFYHRVLDALLRRLNTEKKDFASIEDTELLKLLNDEIGKIIQTHPFISNFVRRSCHNAFIINSARGILEDCVLAIARMVRVGNFRPAVSEVSFGQPKNAGETLGEYEIKLPDNRMLFLDGKIDRIDKANIDGQNVAVIFDYKRSEYGAKFKWSEFYYGLDMQLPIYMLAVHNLSQVAIAGAFYMPVEVLPKQTALNKFSEQSENFDYKAKGIFNGEFFNQLDNTAYSGWSKFYTFRITSKDQQYGDYGKSSILKPSDFEKVLRFTERKIAQLAQEILSGRIDVNPYRLDQKSPCSFCKYKPVCRFDWQINDYNFLKSLNKTNVLKKIEQTNGTKTD